MKPIGYKAFEKGLKCKNFQFAENSEFTHEGEIEICRSGFHYVENPLDALNYYNLCDSEFAEVLEVDKKLTHSDDSKVCTNQIKIGAKIDLKAFIKASFDFLWGKCYDKNDSSQLATSGYYSQLAASGNSSQLAASGNSSQLATSGYSSQLAASGDSSQLAASGNSSQLAASGDYSKLKLTGLNSVGAAIGYNSKIKAIKGCWITLAEYDSNGIILCVKSAKVDGKKLKENTWYILKDKKFTETN